MEALSSRSSTVWLLLLLLAVQKNPCCVVHGFGLNPPSSPQHDSSATASAIRYRSSSSLVFPPPRQASSSSSLALRLSIDDPWDEISSSISSATGKYVDLETVYEKISSTQWYDAFSLQWFSALAQALGDFGVFYAQLPLWAEVLVILVPLISLIGGIIFSISFPPEDYRSGMEPYQRGDYDPIQASQYYSRHQFLVLQRSLEMLRVSKRFLTSLLLDKYVFRSEDRNRAKRADELLAVITKLGPTAIKVGQALSVRQDIIPAEYAAALGTLQDKVPPFDSTRAREILLQELGPEKFSHLKGIQTGVPVASASIGQVYKARIGDREVAVKVQRPNVLAEIALDLYVVRSLAPFYQRITRTGTDLQGLANEWGRGFIAELDYRKEAASTIRFATEMRKRKLNAVCAPTVLTDYSTEQALVTEWVDGVRIDRSDADGIPRLCAVALNSYLVMLLETKQLHCDPHPGNLLVTKDGKLCILDFGMTLDVDPNLQYALLEFVAHLTGGLYDDVPEDFVRMGFLLEDKLDFVRRSGVLEPLKYFLKQLSLGGGQNALRERVVTEFREKYKGLSDDELRVAVRAQMQSRLKDIAEKESVATGITMKVEELQKQNRDAFRIPEWFLYTSRAFLTLEGVSLQADPNYSIIKGCFPYVAKRLVADDDPRARKALKELIYGASNAVDVKRLTDLADGFTSYTTTIKSINQQAPAKSGEVVLTSGQVERISKEEERKKRMVEAEATITLAKDSADILLAPEGNLVQDLLVGESALAASAQFKDVMRRALLDQPKKFREALPLGVGSLLPSLPFENQLAPFLLKTPQEEQAQILARKISQLGPTRPVSTLVADGRGAVAAADGVGNSVGGFFGNNFAFQAPRASSSAAAISKVVQTLREMDAEQAALVVKELRENLPRYRPLVRQLGSRFVKTLLRTASSNIETTLDELEQTGKRPNFLLTQTAKTLSTVAQRGANTIPTMMKNSTISEELQ